MASKQCTAAQLGGTEFTIDGQTEELSQPHPFRLVFFASTNPTSASVKDDKFQSPPDSTENPSPAKRLLDGPLGFYIFPSDSSDIGTNGTPVIGKQIF
jgi:hypothetical protein